MANNKEEKRSQPLIRPEENETFSQKMDRFFLSLGRVPTKEKLFFTRHLSIMLKGGIPFSSAFKTLAAQTKNRTFAKILKQVSEDIDKGLTLTESL
ncbi:hypothetical protein GF382_03210, partial [Candidatus Falkowbacteria bacterium]|nr:hypothetical protein [Candidatus Falkowbacteria bacterium]